MDMERGKNLIFRLQKTLRIMHLTIKSLFRPRFKIEVKPLTMNNIIIIHILREINLKQISPRIFHRMIKNRIIVSIWNYRLIKSISWSKNIDSGRNFKEERRLSCKISWFSLCFVHLRRPKIGWRKE